MNEVVPAQQKLYTTQLIDIHAIEPSEYNPRTIEPDSLTALKKSIAKNKNFFKARPILVNAAQGREGVIVAGEQRWKAAKELGWSKVPIMFILAESLEEEQVYNLLDNKHNGEWDTEARKEILMNLHESGYNMDSIGFTGEELTGIMSGLGEDITIDPDNDPDNQGSTPASKWVCCPECSATFEVTKAVKISPPSLSSSEVPLDVPSAE